MQARAQGEEEMVASCPHLLRASTSFFPALRRGNGGSRVVSVMAGLVPAISIEMAQPCHKDRDARHKAGHDESNYSSRMTVETLHASGGPGERAFTPVFDGLCPAMASKNVPRASALSRRAPQGEE